jgi:uncharacterized membrane protein YidH (DUF202 family)
MMAARTVILWTHALSGAAWIGACACFVIAGLALERDSAEQRDFAARVAPKLDRVNVGAAIVLLATGAVNLALAGWARGFHFPPVFVMLLGTKVLLFIAMTAALGVALRTDVLIRALLDKGRANAVPGAMIRMMQAHGLTIALGSIALVLGLWLAGS